MVWNKVEEGLNFRIAYERIQERLMTTVNYLTNPRTTSNLIILIVIIVTVSSNIR